jgi:Ribbon-helix-helix protein, copG family
VTGGRWYSWAVRKIKTSIYIDYDVDRALARRAAAQRTTKAALIRDALADAAAPAMHVKPLGCGVFEGPGDLSANVDKHLDGFGED